MTQAAPWEVRSRGQRRDSLAMQMLRREETWIHTIFLTDCEYLPGHHARRIREEMARFLEQIGIVYGVHFRESRTEKGLCIVLECIPLPRVMQKIEEKLKEVVRPIPARPRATRVTVKEPEKGAGTSTDGRRDDG
jgi:hypothetical protein